MVRTVSRPLSLAGCRCKTNCRSGAVSAKQRLMCAFVRLAPARLGALLTSLRDDIYTSHDWLVYRACVAAGVAGAWRRMGQRQLQLPGNHCHRVCMPLFTSVSISPSVYPSLCLAHVCLSVSLTWDLVE